MDKFCGSKFWDTSLSWNTNDPDLTKCFEKTILVWVPCAFLWIFSCVEVYDILRSKKKEIPWNWFNLSKLVATSVLCLLTLTDLAVSINSGSTLYNVDVYTPIIKLSSFALTAIFVLYNRKNGFCTSGLLFLFWLMMAICGVVQYRTEMKESSYFSESKYSHVSYLIYYPFVLVVFLLNCFADYPPIDSNKVKNSCPEDYSSFLSKLAFSWFDSIAWKGYKKPLVQPDLWELKPENSAAEVVPLFEKNWRRFSEKNKRPMINNSHVSHKLQNKTSSENINIHINSKPAKLQASIFSAITKTFGLAFLFGAFLRLIQVLLQFVNPQILNLLIKFVTEDEEQWKGYFYAILLFVTASTQTIMLTQFSNQMNIMGLQVRTAVTSAIYKKALRVSSKARKESTVGEIVNLMSVDAQKVVEMALNIHIIWSTPIQIALALYFLWEILGASVLAGLVFMIILIPLNTYVANKNKILHIKQMKNKDERVKLMNEILNGIKVLKLYAWEPSFEEQISKIRTKEVKVMKKSAYLHAATSLIWTCAPIMVALVSFATYVIVDETHVLDASKAFVSISLFNILRMPLTMLPMMITSLIQAMVSIKRINKFMNSEELDPGSVSHDPSETSPLIIEDGSFNWDEDPILKNINIRFENQCLSAVVGSVGSGKSSLLSAFLGEMDKISGRVNTIGSIGYVAQQAWIQNATLRDNILFGKTFDKMLYNRVIEACALKPDFAMLPGGDQTEIGEKGINLSGGQKQRVSLARAVYANADVYFLDDPLSAVDSHVGKHIFNQVIGPEGLLKNKTRVLVTHGITYLPQTDKIIVLKDGEVSESGTYQELLDKKGSFSEFLLQHIVDLEEVEELDVLKEQLSGTIVAEEINRKIERQRSRVSESVSEAGSDKNTFQRKQSCDSTNKSSRQANGSIEELKKKEPKESNKLIDAETSATGNVKWAVYKHYFQSVGWFLVIPAVSLNILYQGLSVGSNVWLGVWADDQSQTNATANGGSRDFYLTIYGVLGLGQSLCYFVLALAYAYGFIRAAVTTHEILLHSSLRWPSSMFDTTPLGRILNRFSSDVNILDTRLPMTFQSAINMLFSVIGTLGVISYSSPLFVSVIIPIGILYYFIQRFYVATSRQLKRLESVTRSPIYSHFGETVTGAQAIRAFREEDRFIRESETKIDVNQTCSYTTVIANGWLAVRLEMIGSFIIFFAALFAIIEKGKAGEVGLSISYSLQITQTLNWLVRMTADVEANVVSVERIKEYSEIPQEAPWEIPNKNLQPLWPDTGKVEFKNYAVRYRSGLDLVLKGVDFCIDGGEKIGIIGRTGAGKSSLTLSLFRIIEAAQGEILIDGVNISSLGLHTLRSRLTIIPQDAILFSGSLRMNLDPFNNHSDDEVWRALEHAHLKPFVKGLTAGLHHEVTEGGDNLSVGQKQLICLGRALLRKTKILILDEATAAVDLETDDLIQRTIRTEFKDCTVLTIAHRLNTIMDSDRIIVLDQGKIVEFDTPAYLLKQQKSIFYSMCKDAGLV